MLIVKAHAVLHKIERAKEALEEALVITARLDSPQLCSFIDFCLAINEEEIAMKKRSQSVESIRKRRSRFSLGSRNSMQSKNSTEDNETSAAASSSAGGASDGATGYVGRDAV